MKNKKFNIFTFVCIACIISCILLSSVLINDVFGKYFAENTKVDAASAASFQVSVTADSGQNIILSKDAASNGYTFTVTSTSEVAIEYDVIVTLPSALPEGVSISIDDLSPAVSGNTYTFSRVGTFDAGGGSTDVVLIFKSTLFDIETVLNGITVDVVAKQID